MTRPPKDIEKQQVVLARRDTREKQFVPMDQLLGAVQGWLVDIQANLFERARQVREEHTHYTENYDEFKTLMAGARPGFVYAPWCDDPAVEEVSWELGLGRSRVMSMEGRMETAQRWYDGESGPDAAISTAAPRNARCGTCGFYLPLAGALKQNFGVCGNEYAADDGRVVSSDHACGAFSELFTEPQPEPEPATPAYDDAAIEVVPTR